MQKFAHTVLDREGRPVPSASIYVVANGTNTWLPIFEDDGVTAKSQPIVTDTLGFAECNLASASCDILVYYDGELQRRINGVYLFDGTTSGAGGFGAMTDVASASTTNVGAISSTFANITGTNTITSFGSSASINKPIYLVRFAGALQLTHSASLQLIGGINTTTTAGDYSLWQYLGSGSWRLVQYIRLSLLSFSGVTISPTTLTANTDNWAPTDLATASVIRASTNASLNLTGLAGGIANRNIRLLNVGSNPLVLTHDATSTAANRFLCPNGASFTLAANTGVDLMYDATSSRWRVVDAFAQVQNTYTTTAITIAAGTGAAQAHGLGSVPRFFRGYLECITADLGYAVGDRVPYDSTNNRSAAGVMLVSTYANATNVGVKFGSTGGISVVTASFVDAPITLSNWRYIIVAEA